MEEGETLEVDGKNVVLDLVLDEAVYIGVDGVFEKIREDDTKRVNGLEIKLISALSRDNKVSKAELEIGDEVEVTIETGDDYKDSIWEYVIGDNSIGVRLNEDFSKLDDRDGYDALDVGMEVCLPNDYLCVRYNGLSEENTEEYEFYVDGSVVGIEGDFVDYDEVFTNGSLFYEDDECLDVIGEQVYFGDSGIELSVNATDIWFNDLVLTLDLKDILVNGTSISDQEDSYLNAYGIVIESPEDSVGDQEFTINIPEERLEGSITVL